MVSRVLRPTWATSFHLALAVLVVAVCVLVYLPGLHGGFLFDDAANLPVLGESGRVLDIDSFLRYITSGRADPTGRPVSLLSFLVDANDWPADPFPFKRTNLILHLLNGVLLYGLLRRMGALHGMTSRRASYAALFAAGAWMLHPLFVSTVLYIVQREAMLPAFFVLCGAHLWLTGRRRLLEGQSHGPAWLIAGIGLCTILAFLSKPNGLLLPLLLLIVDSTLPIVSADANYLRRYRRWRNVLALPIAALVLAGIGWVLLKSIGQGLAPGRSFTLVQRTLTEPTILIDYLKLLFLVDPHYGSLFHDQYPAAADALHPWYTLPACLACMGACIAAWIYRRRSPVVAVAVLFFFGGHLLESTSLALELYFEHRNYLPSMLLFWPIGVLLARPARTAGPFVIGAILLVGFATLAWSTARLWGRPVEQARVWATEASASPRAQSYAAQVEADAGYRVDAERRISAALARFPLEPQIALASINLHCASRSLDESHWRAAYRAVRESPRDPGPLLNQWSSNAIARAGTAECETLDPSHMDTLLDEAAANPVTAAIPGRMQDIDHLRGDLALRRNDPSAALAWFNAALDRLPSPGVALEQAAALGSSGYPIEGRRHLDHYDTLQAPSLRPMQGMKWLHEAILTRQRYWEREQEHLRQTLATDAATKRR